MSDSVDPSKLKVAELRAELTARGLDSKGNKPVLVERLQEALAAEQENHEVEKDDKAGKQQSEKHTEEPNKDEEELQEDQVNEAEELNGEDSAAKDKDDHEEAPVEQLDEDDEKLEEEPEDKSAVDLIKDDFFNGHTEELQGLEEEDIKEEDTDAKPAAEAGQEDASATPVKSETDADALAEAEPDSHEDESWDHKRGRKRAGSPVKTEPDNASNSKKIRPDADVCIISGQDDAFDKSLLVLDWYNSDLSLKIDQSTRLSAYPMSDKSFCYMWHGVRGTYGFNEGRVFFEVSLIRNCEVSQVEENEQHPHVIRVGWSVDDSTFTLGEEPNSWGYGGTGKASLNLQFKDYGCSFKVGDVVGAYLDLDAQPMVMSFTVNGEHQGIAYEINKSDLNGQALFPHVLTKNTEFKVNFGTEEPAYAPLEGYTMAGLVPLSERVQACPGPASRSECEVIMMVGIPASGKTTWVQNYCRENRHMKYNVLGSNDLIDKMKVQGMKRKRNYAGRWDQLISSCMKSLNDLLHMAYNRPRNYIIDQTNVYPTAQKRKMRGFAGYKRRAVVICPTDEDLKQRTLKREKEEGKDVPDSAVLEMKANFKLPEVGDCFDSVEFIEMSREEAQSLIETYNKEGQAACPNKFNNRSEGGRGRRDYNDRGGRDNYRSGGNNNSSSFRGGWDRDRDRRGGYDRRDRGGWNRNNNNNSRDISSRLGSGGGGGGGGGYNRDNRSGGSSSGGGYNRENRGGYNRGGGFRDNNRGGGGGGRSYQSSGGSASSYNKYPDTGYQSNSSWNQSESGSGTGSQYSQSYGSYGQQGTTAYSAQSYGTTAASGYGQTAAGYGWSQQQPQSYYAQQTGGAQSYYSQGYRNDTATTTPATANTWGTASPASNTWSQSATWGQTPAAAAPAAPAAQTHGSWGSAAYAQPAAQQSWSQQSYGGYYGRK